MEQSFFKNAKASVMEFLDNRFDVSGQFCDARFSKTINAIHRQLQRDAVDVSFEMKNDLRIDTLHEMAIQMQDFYRPHHDQEHSFDHRKMVGEIDQLCRERYPFYLQFIL